MDTTTSTLSAAYVQAMRDYAFAKRCFAESGLREDKQSMDNKYDAMMDAQNALWAHCESTCDEF